MDFDISHFLILFVEGRVDLRAQSLELPPIVGRFPRIGFHKIERILLDAMNEESEIQQIRPIKHAGEHVFVDRVRGRDAVEDSHAVRQSSD